MEPTTLSRHNQPLSLPRKPLITLEESISTEISTFLQIRHLKYIHEIDFLEKSPHLSKLRTLKKLHSLTVLDHNTNDRKQKRSKSKAIKIMKPLKKAVRYVGESEKQDSMKSHPLTYLLPLFFHVSKYSLKVDNIFYWKFFCFCPRVKNLQIEMIAPPGSSSYYSYYTYSSQFKTTKSNANQFILEFKKKLTHYLLQKQCVKHLSIRISTEFKEIAIPLLGWLDEIKTYLPNLKSFSLDDVLNTDNFLMKQDKKTSLSQEYLRYTTHLALEDAMSSHFCSPIGLEYFRNLASLSVTLSSCESIANVNQLIHLTSLKALDLEVSEVPYRAEKSFLHKFVLPPNITKLKLRLSRFIWKSVSNSKAGKKALEEFFASHPRFLGFAQQFKNATNLKSFRLSVTDPYSRGCSKIMGLMAVAIFKQISTLETLEYNHFIAPPRPKQGYAAHSENRSLSLGYFYQGLESSKKSLRTVSIHAPQIIISDFSNIRKKLPKLQNISIRDRLWRDNFPDKENIFGAYNIFNAWNKKVSPSTAFPPLFVDIGELAVCNEKKLKLYLGTLRSIPQDWDLTIKLNISRKVDQKLFGEEVSAFLEQVNPKNNLSLILNYKMDSDDKEFQEIETAATKSSSLKFLKLKSGSSVLLTSRRGVIY